jgi:hypothetical protein
MSSDLTSLRVHQKFLSYKIRDEYEVVKMLPSALLAQQGASTMLTQKPSRDDQLDVETTQVLPGYAYPFEAGMHYEWFLFIQ